MQGIHDVGVNGRPFTTSTLRIDQLHRHSSTRTKEMMMIMDNIIMKQQRCEPSVLLYTAREEIIDSMMNYYINVSLCLFRKHTK